MEAWRELLKYPNPTGLHPVEAAWRDHARELLYELEMSHAEQTKLAKKLSNARLRQRVKELESQRWYSAEARERKLLKRIEELERAPCGCPVPDCQHHRGLAPYPTWRERAEAVEARVEELEQENAYLRRDIDARIELTRNHLDKLDTAEAKLVKVERENWKLEADVAELAGRLDGSRSELRRLELVIVDWFNGWGGVHSGPFWDALEAEARRVLAAAKGK